LIDNGANAHVDEERSRNPTAGSRRMFQKAVFKMMSLIKPENGHYFSPWW
jgi:hypothetical protein